MFGIGTRRRKDESPVFTNKDLERLLHLLPPLISKDSERPFLLKTVSGDRLIRSDTATTRLEEILRTTEDAIPVSNLSTILNIQDPQPLLEDKRLNIIHSGDLRNLFPEPVQRDILQKLEAECETTFVPILEKASKLGIRLDDLRNLVQRRQSLTLLDIAGQQWITSKLHLQDVDGRLRKTLHEAQDAAVDVRLDSEKFQAPPRILEHLSDAALSEQTSRSTGTVILQGRGIHFTPESVLEQKASQVKKQHEDLIQRISNEVQLKGYCIQTKDSSTANSTLMADIVTNHQQKHDICLETLDNRSSICFITPAHLSSKTQALSSEANKLANKSYIERDLDTDITFNQELIQALVASSETPELSSIILAKPSTSHSISTDFASTISSLQSETQTTYQAALRTRILALTTLYSTSLALSAHASDASLPEKLSAYLHSYLQTDLLPSALTTLLTPSTVPSKATHAELLRCQTSISEAANVPDIETALRRLARRTKVDTLFSNDELHSLKQDILEAKIKGMNAMKRESDVLQNLIWVLLATVPFTALQAGQGSTDEKKEASWVSSGKDTTRMIKFYRQAALAVGQGQWGEWAERLGTFRDLVKEGKKDGVKEEMVGLAEQAVESWR